MFSKEQLLEYIKMLFELDIIPHIIMKQVERFPLELRCSYFEIAETLCFYMEHRGGRYDPKYGIGIVKSLLDESRAFSLRKRREEEELVRQARESKKIDQTKNNIKCKKTTPFGRKRNIIDLSQIGKES